MSFSDEYVVAGAPAAWGQRRRHPLAGREGDGGSQWLADPGRVAILDRGGRTAVLCYASLLVLLSSGISLERGVTLALIATLLWSVAVEATVRATGMRSVAAGATATTTLGIATGTIAFWVLSLSIPLGPRAILAAPLGVCACLAAIGWTKLVGRAARTRPTVLIVRAGRRTGVAELTRALALEAPDACDLMGVVDCDPDAPRLEGLPVHGGLDDLADVIRRTQPNVVVLAVDRKRLEVFRGLLDAAHLRMTVLGLAEFYEQMFGRVPIRNLTPAWFMSLLHPYRRRYAPFGNRVFDLVVALTGIVVTAPLLPLIAVLVRLTPGPAIYRQTRLGLRGAPFTIYKFRTMAVDAEASGAPAWALAADPRVTTVGRVLRRTRLDELPQFWNVLKGDMSIVGPRPERPEHLEALTESVPYWTTRLLVKPGITGWAQLRYGYADDSASSERKLAYDLWYVRHRSLWIDFVLCIKTLGHLVTGIGAR